MQIQRGETENQNTSSGHKGSQQFRKCVHMIGYVIAYLDKNQEMIIYLVNKERDLQKQ